MWWWWRRKDELPDPAFDLIIDKALMDAVLCGEDAWRRVTAMVREMHRECKRWGPSPTNAASSASRRICLHLDCPLRVVSAGVLKPGGRYVVLSYGQPTSRVGYLSVPGCDWSVTATEIRE